MTDIKTIPAFDRDLKKLARKYSSIEGDVALLMTGIRCIKSGISGVWL